MWWKLNLGHSSKMALINKTHERTSLRSLRLRVTWALPPLSVCAARKRKKKEKKEKQRTGHRLTLQDPKLCGFQQTLSAVTPGNLNSVQNFLQIDAARVNNVPRWARGDKNGNRCEGKSIELDRRWEEVRVVSSVAFPLRLPPGSLPF